MRCIQNLGFSGTLVTGLALIVLSCSGPDSGSPTITNVEVQDGTGADAGIVQEVEIVDFASQPDDVTVDASFEVAISPGDPGFTCTSSSDCISGFCITTPDGKKCSVECMDECPFGWTCSLHMPSLPDEIYICVPVFMNLCKPCNKNADCSMNGVDTGDTCLDFLDAGGFCGGNCETSSCPPGYECKTSQDVHGAVSEQCRLVQGECKCPQWFVAEGASTTCQIKNEWGVCQGERICTADGLTDCSALFPAQEICNGLDDDCDGEVDEGSDWGECLVENVYGVCSDTYSCEAGMLQCPTQVPEAEICDGADNNCNGEIDEDFADTDTDGEKDCLDEDDDGDGDPDTKDCQPLDKFVHHGAQEVCNGQDDNCDSGIDEGFVDSDFDGLKDCVDDDDDNDGDPDETDCQPLNPQVHHDVIEECNGVDDDCSGGIDDGFGTLECGQGECFHQVPACESGELQFCNPFEGSGPEVCDGKDNNCNDIVDDGFPVGQPCLAGLGQCAVAGLQLCSEDGLSTKCSAVPLEPDCSGKECGDDGCGGECGQCPGPNYACMAGVCICQPDCVLKNCGDDGCGGSCGSCPAIEACNDGICNGCDDGNNTPMDGCSGGQIAEFLVNTEVTSSQQIPDVDILSDGGFVIVWESNNQDGDGMGIFGQRFLSDGQAVGEEFQVNTDPSFNQEEPEVAGLEDGGFVVVWQSEEFEDEDSDHSSVFGRRYNGTGQAITGEFRVHVETVGWQRAPSIAALKGGGFVVVWETGSSNTPVYADASGIYARLFTAGGGAIGNEFLVNTYLWDKQQKPSVAHTVDGFVTSWQSDEQDGSFFGVYAQAFSLDGDKIGPEFGASTYTFGDQWYTRCTGLPNGNLVILWQGDGGVGQNGEVYASIHDPEGALLHPAWVVNSVMEKWQKAGDVVALAGGGFVTAWESWGYSSYIPSAILAQRFDNDGIKVGMDFKVHAENGEMRRPRIAAFEDGTFIIVWDNLGDDGSGRGIFAQRFSAVGKKIYK